MKFSFPFFGKKSQPVDQKLADPLPQDIPVPEMVKPSINWSAVNVDPMPGFEALPEQAQDPISGLSAESLQTTPLSAGVDSSPQSGQHPPEKSIATPVSEPEESSEEENLDEEEALDEVMPLQKVSVSADSTESLGIHDLIIEPASVVPEVAAQSNLETEPVLVPELIIETIDVVVPESITELAPEISSVESATALEPAPTPVTELVIEAVEDFASESVPEPSPISVSESAPAKAPTPVTELVIEAVEDFVLEPVAQSVPEKTPEEPATVPVPAPQAISPQAATRTGIPASPPMQLIMTKEDVIAAYKIFLNRLPESFIVIKARLDSPIEANLIDFALSDEFIRRADLPAIVFPLAKKIIEAGETALSTNQSPGEVAG